MSKGSLRVCRTAHTAVAPLKGERRLLHPFTTHGSCGLTVHPGPVTSARTTLGFLPVPYTLHLSAWSAKGEKLCLTKGAGPTQAWTVHTTSFEPSEVAPAFLGCCHLPHPVTCHIHFSRQGVKVALTQCLAIAPSLSAPFCSIHVLFKFRKRSSDGRLSLKCNSQMSTCKPG